MNVKSAMSVTGNPTNVEEQYLNHDRVFYMTGWRAADAESNEDGQSDDGDYAYFNHELDVPDDHLVEIYGFETLIGDTTEGDGKFDVWVWNNVKDVSEMNNNWATRVGARGESLIYHSAGATDEANGLTNHQNSQIWYPKPILSTGRIGATAGGGNDVSELGLLVFWDTVEVGDNEVMKQLLQLE